MNMGYKNSKFNKQPKKVFNPGEHYKFKVVDNIKIETIESFLARGGVIQKYDRKGELQNPDEVLMAENLSLDEEIELERRRSQTKKEVEKFDQEFVRFDIRKNLSI